MAPPALSPARSKVPERHEHLVGFYSGDDFLAGSVSSFLAPALAQGGTAIVLATPEHRTAFGDALAERGIDVATHERYYAGDAWDVVGAIMRGEVPDEQRFRATVGTLVEQAAGGGGPVHVYGELVALLAAEGNPAAAIALEGLWNDLADRVSFDLFCGYPIELFADEVDAAFHAVCDAHGRVLPSTALTAVTDPGERTRAVRLLQEELAAGIDERDVLRRQQGRLEHELQGLTESDRIRRQFAAMTVHDIRTPATAVAGILRLIQQDWERFDADQVREYLGVALRSVEQIDRLVSDLMLVSRLEAGALRFEFTRVALGAVARQVVGEVRASTGRHVDLHIGGEIPHVRADEGRQVQILQNLLDNAIRYSDPSTPVSVRLERRNGEVVVRVEDRGPGIPARDLPNLFRPFWRAAHRNADRGTGLGLAITKALVEGQGGWIEVDSVPGVGTTFVYTAPVASE